MSQSSCGTDLLVIFQGPENDLFCCGVRACWSYHTYNRYISWAKKHDWNNRQTYCYIYQIKKQNKKLSGVQAVHLENLQRCKSHFDSTIWHHISQTKCQYDNGKVRKCTSVIITGTGSTVSPLMTMPHFLQGAVRWELHLNNVLFMLERCNWILSNLPATIVQYRQITIGHRTKYYKEPSGEVAFLQ